MTSRNPTDDADPRAAGWSKRTLAAQAMGHVEPVTRAVVAPLLILTAGVLVSRVVFAWAMLPRGEDYLWWSFPFGSAVTLVLAVLYYRFGGWRRAHALVDPAEAHLQSEAVQEPGGRINATSEGAAGWANRSRS